MIEAVKSYGSNLLALCADGYLRFLNSLEIVTHEIPQEILISYNIFRKTMIDSKTFLGF
ncbi:hypothetical protein HanPI659440_Chr16g0647921 [Helianthus annuus]|nr:hypothetical protein HanPI659440_Chr16g0647921 [Helianthus annuus]